METIALLFLFGVFIILAYTLGLRNGQKLKNNEEIKIPEINPIKIVRNEIETFEQKNSSDRFWHQSDRDSDVLSRARSFSLHGRKNHL